MDTGAKQIIKIFGDVQSKCPYSITLASGGFVDAVPGKVSDVDINLVTPDFKNLDLSPLVCLPARDPDRNDSRWIYRIAGYDRPVHIYAIADEKRATRAEKHRSNELMLNTRFPKLAFAAAILKSNGSGTEIAWAAILGYVNGENPYDMMAQSEDIIEARAQGVTEHAEHVLQWSTL